jgi:hypothetical protein
MSFVGDLDYKSLAILVYQLSRQNSAYVNKIIQR